MMPQVNYKTEITQRLQAKASTSSAEVVNVRLTICKEAGCGVEKLALRGISRMETENNDYSKYSRMETSEGEYKTHNWQGDFTS